MSEEGFSIGSSCQGFARSVGFALGELLLLAGRSEDLADCIREIEATAHAAILSSGLGKERREPPGRETAVSEAALRVVRSWYEETDGLSRLGDAVATLRGVLLSEGIPSPPPKAE